MKKRVAVLILAVAAILSLGLSACTTAEEPGTYSVDARLSCFIPAMGGIEFGEPLLSSTEYTLSENGEMYITLRFVKSSVSIYSITCYTFVDAAPPATGITNNSDIPSGTIGYYDECGNLVTENVTYTLSTDTALNCVQEEVNYVDSVTFPISEKKDSYSLTLCINSQVMGAQFTQDGYTASLTLDWDTLEALK